MHGRNRKSAIFPPALSSSEIKGNIQKIVERIKNINPDFVTLQEVDEFSILSGKFNQFEFFKSELNYPYSCFGESCNISFLGKKLFVSGNAIFSRYPLENCESHKFPMSFPVDRMGFVISDSKLPNGEIVTIVSLHLVPYDWIRFNSRARELRLLEDVVFNEKRKFILSGDFNCDFMGKENTLRDFAKRLSLKLYKPEDKDLNTSQSWNPKKRIDWVLLSESLEFISYNNLNEKLSDHLGIHTTFSL